MCYKVRITPDLRFALRLGFARRSGAPLLVSALFALGVGLAGGMWAVVDAALLRPLPFRDGNALVAVMEAHPQRGLMNTTPANFLDWATRVSTLENVAGGYPIDVSFVGTGLPERVVGAKVTERFFELWGVAPVSGRTFQRNDFGNRQQVAVLGHSLWARHFAGANRMDASVHIDGELYTVVGVMPDGFRTAGNAELWIPWIMSPDEQRERRFHLVSTIGRLREGSSATEAQSELATIYQRLAIDHPDTTANWTARVLPFRNLLLGESPRALAVLGGAVLILVVVAWINVASLLLAWLASRRDEFLLRLALGATTTRVVRQLLVETLVLATAGMAAGLVIARWFVQLFGAVGVSTALPFDFDPSVNWRVILAAAALLLVSVGATAIGPSVIAVRRSKDRVPRRAGPMRGVGQRSLLATQVALSIVLLSAAAGLLVAFQQLDAAAAPVVGGGPTLAMEISRSETRQPDDAQNRLFFRELLSRVGDRPEVRAVAAASYVPPTPPLGNVRFSIEGRPTSTETQTGLVSAVSGTAFNLLGIPLARGRLIDDRDGENAPHVAVISKRLANTYWPDEDPIGRRILLVGTDTPATIVGIVGDVLQPLSTDPRAASVIYLSYLQFPWPFMTLIVAPASDAGAAVAAIRQETARLDAAQAAGSVRVLDEMRMEWMDQPRLRTTVVTLFGVATLLLTLAGLYARIVHSVALRAKELAIRQALGARPTDVVRQVTLEAAVIIASGLIAGIALLPFSSQLLRTLIADAAPIDLRLIAGVAATLALSALASTYWPARRAGRVNLIDLMRSA